MSESVSEEVVKRAKWEKERQGGRGRENRGCTKERDEGPCMRGGGRGHNKAGE